MTGKRQFVVTPSGLMEGWAVRCDGQTLSTHFTEGEALVEATYQAEFQAQRDKVRAEVYVHMRDGRFREARCFG
jgi:hypothetical protein